MGDSKRKPALIGLNRPPAPAKRPTEALIRLRQAVQASKGVEMDADTASFMSDLAALAVWLDHLEPLAGISDVSPTITVRLRGENGVWERKIGPNALLSLVPEGWAPILIARLKDLMLEAGIAPVTKR